MRRRKRQSTLEKPTVLAKAYGKNVAIERTKKQCCFTCLHKCKATDYEVAHLDGYDGCGNPKSPWYGTTISYSVCAFFEKSQPIKVRTIRCF